MSNGSGAAFLASCAALAGVLLLAPVAWAGEPAPASDAPMATAQGAPAAPPSTVQTDIKDFIAGDDSDKNDPLPDNKPHGFVSVGVGTNGYREIAGAVTIPVNPETQVTLAIDDGQINGRRH
jgi:hypothetical protein